MEGCQMHFMLLETEPDMMINLIHSTLKTFTLCAPQTYNQSQSNKRSVYKSITGKNSSFHLYPNSPRMLPLGINPVVHKMHINCGQFDHGESSRRSGGGRRPRSEGRASLIHPQNLSECLGRSRVCKSVKGMLTKMCCGFVKLCVPY